MKKGSKKSTNFYLYIRGQEYFNQADTWTLTWHPLGAHLGPTWMSSKLTNLNHLEMTQTHLRKSLEWTLKWDFNIYYIILLELAC